MSHKKGKPEKGVIEMPNTIPYETELIERIVNSSVSIVAVYGDNVKHHATGTLVRFADHFFIVTAGHAIREYHKYKREHYSDLSLYADSGHGNTLVPLYGDFIATRWARDPALADFELQGDEFDVALWEIKEPTLGALRRTKTFLNRSDISIDADCQSGHFYVAGIPCEWEIREESSLHWKWLKFPTEPIADAAEIKGFRFNPEYQIALGIPDLDNLPSSYKGISGCSIWKLSNEHPSASEALVVGIQTAIFPEKPSSSSIQIIKGTQWKIVLRPLMEKYPELREVFRLWLPNDR